MNLERIYKFFLPRSRRPRSELSLSIGAPASLSPASSTPTPSTPTSSTVTLSQLPDEMPAPIQKYKAAAVRFSRPSTPERSS